MRDVCSRPDRQSAAAALDGLAPWAMRPNARETKAVAGTIEREREGILAWWDRNPTNAVLEGLNPVVRSVRRAARGSRNTSCFGTMIFPGLGRLDFSAQTSLACATH